MIQPSDKILIVGAGCFGLSTAYHLLARGFENVTVLDKAVTLPAEDAASCDINKVVRSSYDDILYTNLARDAIAMWRDTSAWGDTYHECGVLVLGNANDKHAYASRSYVNDLAIGVRAEVVENGVEIRERGIFPPSVRTADFNQVAGYLNRDAGWVNAAQGVSLMMDKIRGRSGKILPGKEVCRLIHDLEVGRTRGVECRDGSTFHADLVVIATGAWTASAFPQLELGEKCLATGQCVATIQLTEEEAKLYEQCPIVLNFSTGFYVFPPNKDKVVKMALHAAGYTYFPQHQHGDLNDARFSTPRTVSNAKEDGLRIPKAALREIRAHLREVYPDLAEKPFLGTRMCWYTDSPDGDWLIGYHPNDSGIMMATAGSGHAYKFLPMIGTLVANAIQGALDPSMMVKFAVDRMHSDVDQSRFGKTVAALDLDQLCTREDLWRP